MSDLIAKTDPIVLANYIVWRVVQTNVRYLDDRFEDIKQVDTLFSVTITSLRERNALYGH